MQTNKVQSCAASAGFVLSYSRMFFFFFFLKFFGTASVTVAEFWCIFMASFRKQGVTGSEDFLL